MGHIFRVEGYEFIQNLIQKLMKDLQLPAWHFDYAVWNTKH